MKMNLHTACIVDTPDSPLFSNNSPRCYWRTWEAPGGVSALELQAKYQNQTRAEFLQWVHDFGEAEIAGKKVKDHLRMSDGFSAWWLSILFERHPAAYGPGLYEIFKLRAFEQWVKEQNINTIAISADDEALASTLEKFCSATNRKYEIYPSQTVCPKDRRIRGFLKRLYLVRVLLMLRFVFRWWFTERKKFSGIARLKPEPGLGIAAWFPNIDEEAARDGLFVSKYWMGFHELLKKVKEPVNWLLIPICSLKDIQKNIRKRDEFTKNTRGTLVFWQECLGFREVLRILGDWFLISWRGRKLSRKIHKFCNWPNSQLNIFSYVRPLWEESVCGQHLTQMLLMYRGIRNWVHKVGSQRLVFTPSEMQVWERVLFYSFRQLGKTQIYANMHSMVGSGDFRFFLAKESWNNSEILDQMPDFFCCNGSGAYDFMSSGGFPEDRLINVEALRYPYLQPDIPKNEHTVPMHLVVATTYYQPEVDAQIRILSEACKMGLYSFIHEILIKPHPAHPVEPYLEKYFLGLPLPKVVNDNLSDLLQPTTLVYAGNSTTVAVEAAYKGSMLIVQDVIDGFNLSPLASQKSVCFVRTAEDLLEAVKRPQRPCISDGFFILDNELPRWQKILNL